MNRTRLGLGSVLCTIAMLATACGTTHNLGPANNGTSITAHVGDSVTVDLGPFNNSTIQNSNPYILRLVPTPPYPGPTGAFPGKAYLVVGHGKAVLTGSISLCPVPTGPPPCLAPDLYWTVTVYVP